MTGAGKGEQQGTLAWLRDRQWAMQAHGESLQHSASEQEGLTQGDRRAREHCSWGPPFGVVFASLLNLHPSRELKHGLEVFSIRLQE